MNFSVIENYSSFSLFVFNLNSWLDELQFVTLGSKLIANKI